MQSDATGVCGLDPPPFPLSRTLFSCDPMMNKCSLQNIKPWQYFHPYNDGKISRKNRPKRSPSPKAIQALTKGIKSAAFHRQWWSPDKLNMVERGVQQNTTVEKFQKNNYLFLFQHSQNWVRIWILIVIRDNYFGDLKAEDNMCMHTITKFISSSI